MSIYMSRAELEEISEGLITAYANKFTGIDITPAYIDYANEQAKKENLNAKFICQTFARSHLIRNLMLC